MIITEKVAGSQGEPPNVVEFPDGTHLWAVFLELITTTACIMVMMQQQRANMLVDFAWIGKSILHHTLNDETNHATGSSEDIGSELKPPEWATQPTQPYQLPRLGVSHESKQHKKSSVSAMSILSRSAAYKSLQEKALKKEEENDENENKNNINKIDYGKAAVEKKSSHDNDNDNDNDNDDDGTTSEFGLGMEGEEGMAALHPALAPFLTNYNAIDPLGDPVLWSSLVPPLQTRSSQPIEHATKTETSSDYSFFQEEDLLPT
uniref:Uncharacterized protein n=1 Tax=Lactuca sativa TaxID=4236 RepID=A0A9R1UE75_LACSA|nr:hypothetical protein LSAT_V11C900466730 [Lactuca sativa]